MPETTEQIETRMIAASAPTPALKLATLERARESRERTIGLIDALRRRAMFRRYTKECCAMARVALRVGFKHMARELVHLAKENRRAACFASLEAKAHLAGFR